jgi:hypothetical protein
MRRETRRPKFNFDFDDPDDLGAPLAGMLLLFAAFVLIRYFFGLLTWNSWFWWNWPNGFWH